MQPFQCDVAPQRQETHRTTHTGTSIVAKHIEGTKRPQPQPPHRRGSFHRRLQPLYRNRVFFRVKWLQPAMKATSSVRRLRLGSFGSFYVFCNNACSCVRSSMRFLTLWCQIALEWLHDVAWALCWGGSRSTKPCVFPCKVAAAGDESYLVCAAVAAGVVWFLLCVLQQCLFLCA